MARLALENISKSFGALTVLDGVSLDIENREFVALVGPSGCGKSTLLRIIAGLETMSDGTISIDGKVVNDVGPQMRDLAMVFQSYALYPHMTCRQNIAYPLKLRGASQAVINKAVNDAATTLHLDQYLDRFPRALSGGQRQRVAMGRAMVRKPRAFLFDEPLSNLDAKLRNHMRIEIRQLHQELEATSIYVTHDQIEAMTMADRIVVMNKGRIEQMGTPLELFDRPDNLFVASFLGSPTMNLISGVVIREPEGPKLRLVSQNGVIPLVSSSARNDQNIVLGIRPQHVDVVDPAKAAIRGVVQVVEHTGCETNLVIDVGSDPFTVQTRQRRQLNPGETVGLAFAPEDVHLFDQATQRRV
jgi:multiple sugar transport system ATP-binding protein